MEVAVKNETVESVETKDDDDFLKLGFGSAEEGSDEEAEVPEISWFRELKKEEKPDKKDEKQEKKEKKAKRNPPSGPDEEEKALMEAIFGNKEKLFKNLKGKDEKEVSEAPSNKRKHAWTDSDDEGVTIEEGLKKSHKQSFLLDPKAQYSKLLSNKYQKLVGTPKWAKMDRVASDSEDEELLKTVGHVLKGKKGSILENSIEFQRLKDLNRSTYCEGLVTSVEFHPTSTVALVSGLRGVASIYSIEKTKCEKLHSIQFEKFPIKCSKLSLDGSEAILGSHKKFFYSYNLITGQKLKYFVPTNATKMTNFEISPDGKLLALAGRFGEIHILNAITKEWIVTLKQEYEVTGMGFSSDSRILYCHSNDSEVSVFNLTAQKMMHRFYDDGCLSGTSITMSPNGKFLATGSGQGIVNIYGTEDLLENKTPTPVKIFKNLVTSISSLAYNPSSELLGMCSREIDDALRLAHFPSATIYANFPGNNLAKAKPNILRFSPGGRYLAVGNTNGRVSLYILKHYEEF